MRYSGIDNDPNSPALTTSDWEIRNRLFVSATFTWEFFKNAPTSITLFYNGQTGRPFSFIAKGNASSNLNNDGFGENDLLYIPRNSSEILLGTISNKQFVPSTKTGTTYDDLEAFISNDDYLSENRGKIAERNGAHAPWRDYFNLHISQDIPDLWGFGAVQFYVDIENVANLINSDWGKVSDVASTPTIGNDTYNILSYQGMVTYEGRANTPVYSFTKPTNNTAFTYDDYYSRWAMQVGVRYSF
jgi:hypothetical protein